MGKNSFGNKKGALKKAPFLLRSRSAVQNLRQPPS